MRDDLTPWNLEATFTVSYNTVSDSKLNVRNVMAFLKNYV